MLCSRITADARSGELFAHALWVAAYTAFAAILGMGYARFLYSGDHNQWRAGVARPYASFFASEVFYTLVAMGAVLLPGAARRGACFAPARANVGCCSHLPAAAALVCRDVPSARRQR